MSERSPRFRVVLVAAPDARAALNLARGLVKGRLAACVNVIPGATSVYRWKGRIHEDAEALLLIKTRAAVMRALIRFVKEKHPAEVPEIISLPVTESSRAYLEWLGANTILAKAGKRPSLALPARRR